MDEGSPDKVPPYRRTRGEIEDSGRGYRVWGSKEGDDEGKEKKRGDHETRRGTDGKSETKPGDYNDNNLRDGIGCLEKEEFERRDGIP